MALPLIVNTKEVCDVDVYLLFLETYQAAENSSYLDHIFNYRPW
jgi:hypothetical protein